MKPFFLCVAVALTGCAHLSNRGGVTLVGRGAALLHQQGDPVLGTGQFTKEVSPDFAAGMAKAKTDDAWNDYWALQDEHAQGTRSGPLPSDAGQPVSYPVTVPAHQDPATGIIKAPQTQVLKINE